MIAALVSFLTALPQLLTMIQSLVSWLNKVSGNDISGFLVKSGAAFDLLSKAQTEDEHAAASKAISDLLNNLPSK